MRIEQGVKIVEKGDRELLVSINEHYVRENNEGGYIVHQATKEHTMKIIAITLNDTPEAAIAIAKNLNEDLKRGDV